MSMLPFATRTDMIEALKLSDTKLSDVDTFLATLLAEHDAQGVRAQLTNLWIVNVLLILREEDDTAQAEGTAGLGTRFGHQQKTLHKHYRSYQFFSYLSLAL
jgi:hypothetical protein